MMTTKNAHFQVAADVVASWRDDVLTGKPPLLYRVGIGELERIEVGPGLVTLLGGAPGDGKTALSIQFGIDALRLSEVPRVSTWKCPPAVLLDRQLARLSGVPLTAIRYRRLAAQHADRIDQAMHTLEPLAERLCFLRSPFSLENVAEG